jgi:hypothetical protein
MQDVTEKKLKEILKNRVISYTGKNSFGTLNQIP